ncbi:MAG: efflux RND transporter permease subunit, partial [Longimonas sp.]|uniref:efflux RND transporter permease subunit n=1 Tax=Longimonas sp. TaxID=2039626 RepID=UPI00334F0809
RIWKFDPNQTSVVSIAVESRYDLETLSRILQRDLAKRIEQVPGVGTIELRGEIEREIQINLKRDRLQASGLTADEVRQAIASENAVVGGGNVKDGLRDMYVRALGEYTSVDEIRNTVIAYAEGQPIRVIDVANVEDGYQDTFRMTELDGMPIVQMRIQKQSDANTVAVADGVRAEVERINAERNDMHLTVISDQSTYIQSSIDSVQSSLLWGALLAIFVLYMFLRNGSTTFVIALSIPISIIATFGLLYFGGLTLNIMTFGGLALGVGLIVDNAIVVLENIVRHREENGRSLPDAASIGTREVAGAIVASTLTTSVIFLPLVFAQATSASLFQSLALVVVFSLVCSLFVALTLVPMLASRFLTNEANPDASTQSAFQRRFQQLEEWYKDKLRTVITYRKTVFASTGVLLAGALFIWPMLPVELAPQTDANEIRIDMSMDSGTNLAVVQSYLQELEDVVKPLVPEEDVQFMTTEIRGSRARIDLAMRPEGERTTEPSELADYLRENIEGVVPGVEIRVRARTGLWVLRRAFSSGGGDEETSLEMELRGYDLEQAQIIGDDIKNRLEQLDGIADVEVGGEDRGQPEQNIFFDRERIAQAGLTTQGVATAIQTNLAGTRAGAFRVEGDEFPIIVRLRPEDRLTVQDLDNIAVRSPDGGTIPASAFVQVDEGRGPSTVRRINGQRVTYLSATLTSDANLNDVVERAQSTVAQMNLPEQFSLTFGGEYREQQEAQRDFMLAIVMALLLIYMVMAGQFERFLDPFIVMFSVPLALVGVVPTLYLTGTTVNIQSIMGLIMLIGIVVNNAIVLVDYINIMRRERGLELSEAVVEAGRLRLRPILMTALTTMLGLLPLAIGLGAGGDIQAPLARVVIGGLFASTLITLVLIPVAYISVENAAVRVRSYLPDWSWLPQPGPAEVRPAKS